MNKKTILTISKSVIIVLILLAVVFALRAPAADLNYLPDDVKGDYVDAQGLPYFSEMDSYYNLRLTENFVDHGHAGDEVVNGSVMDMHRNAPDGGELNYELGIVYVTDFLHSIANMFGSYSVKEVAFWAGAIVSCFAVIPAYIFARRLTNDYGAITAALIIGLAPNYFAHTFPGFFDTDMFYYIFSLFFILFFMECLKSDNLIYKIIFAILSVISIGLFSMSWTGYVFYVALMGLYIVLYLIAMFVLKIGNDSVDEYPSRLSWFVHQKDFLSVIMIAVIAFIGLGILRGFDGILGIFSQVFGLLDLQSASTVVGGFPNVLISVAEMQMPALLGAGMGSAFLASTAGAVNGIGGIAVLFAGLAVLYACVVRLWKLLSKKEVFNPSKKPPKDKRISAAEKIDKKYKFNLSLDGLAKFTSSDDINKQKRILLMYGLLFIVWTIVACLAVSRGSRFITTLALPFGIMAGVAVGYFVDYVKSREIDDKYLMAILVIGGFLAAYPLATVNMTLGIILFLVIVILGAIFIYAKGKDNFSFKNVPIKKYIAVVVIVLALVSPSVCGAYQTANQVVPSTSDPMWDSMEWIDENMPEDVVITSWWDFGYLFEIAADRQVTFDGGSQTGQRAFWLGQAMTTDNLELSAGIFRMLDTTGDRATDALTNMTGSAGEATDILIEILPMTAADARNTLINSHGLTAAQADEVISYTHPDNPRPVVFVASSDMLQKAGWWSYFGQWDFDAQNSTNYQYYLPSSEITVEPGQQGSLTLLNETGMAVNVNIDRTGNNTTADVETVYANNGSQIMINGTEYNPLDASRLVIIENGQVVTNQSISGSEDGNYTLFMLGVNNTYTPILMSNILENSMFTRLYLEGGFGQDIFTQVHSEQGVSLWQVNFNNTAAGGAVTSTNNTN